jgi:glycerol-3-phosphate acyltransferase PlsY
MLQTGFSLVGAYLLGSIPFSYLVARRFGVADVRRVGSGNVGATNVMRAAGRTAGALALLLDASKGAAASLVAQRLAPGPFAPSVAAVLAVLGHMFPVWLSLRGGKGVATGAGAFLPLAPWAVAGGVVAFGVTAAATRYVSLGSCIGSIALAALAFSTSSSAATPWCATAAAALVVLKHRENLQRIAAGTESRLGAGRR